MKSIFQKELDEIRTEFRKEIWSYSMWLEQKQILEIADEFIFRKLTALDSPRGSKDAELREEAKEQRVKVSSGALDSPEVKR